MLKCHLQIRDVLWQFLKILSVGVHSNIALKVRFHHGYHLMFRESEHCRRAFAPSRRNTPTYLYAYLHREEGIRNVVTIGIIHAHNQTITGELEITIGIVIPVCTHKHNFQRSPEIQSSRKIVNNVSFSTGATQLRIVLKHL